ncbi:unnamed protein product, partial [Nesidiocoris tenuis]
MKCWKGQVNVTCKVILLDQQEFSTEATDKTLGKDLLNEIFRRIGVHEVAYFGLRYIDSSNQTQWLDLARTVRKQVKNSNCTFYFGVKFYVVDPCKLNEESTRYQFFLQIKQDILQGRIPVGFDLAAELGAYVVQSELGDFDARRHTPGYVSEFRFIANQTVELENRIASIHTELQGQQPALAELNFLEKVKWLEMYGVDLHPVLSEDNHEYFLGLSPTNVIVLRNKLRVATYSWSRIVKIYSKGKYFMIRVDSRGADENTYGFETPSKSACKHLCRSSVDLREFFRNNQRTDPDDTARSKTDDFDLKGNNQQFVRVPSKRYQRRAFDIVQPTSLESCDTINARIQLPTCEPLQPNAPASEWTRSESPKSTQSLPPPPTRGLYSSNSRISSSRRSISMESRSSNDSKSLASSVGTQGHKRGSDSESEVQIQIAWRVEETTARRIETAPAVQPHRHGWNVGKSAARNTLHRCGNVGFESGQSQVGAYSEKGEYAEEQSADNTK